MAGLLRLETSFATRKLHLGYRALAATNGPMTGQYRAHEFHYSTTQRALGTPLFAMTDAEGTALPDAGLIDGTVMGSFAHVITSA
jgi:cobyrinic acid a,c-diamide synthase